MIHNKFLAQIKNQLPEQTSIIDAIATALDISYDAAHRRTSMKSKFSLEESVTLAKYYNVSLDQLFETIDAHNLSVEKTKTIHNENELKGYFENSANSLRPLLNQKDSQIYYSAKDIPIFYTIGSDILSRFKIYVWLKLLDDSFENKSFTEFAPKVGLLESAKNLGQLYQNLNTTEIWDVTTVNSTLKQIHFYNQAGHVTNKTALELCDALKNLMSMISDKVNSNASNFKLYYNELLLMNNNVFVSTPDQKSLFVPTSVLSYYLTSDRRTCEEAEIYLNKQMKHSKLLNTSGEKEKRTFFNKIKTKIDALKQLILATQILDFE